MKAGEIAGKPVMADVQPYLPGRPYEELVLERLRPGDIHTHVYAQQFHILDENRKMRLPPAVLFWQRWDYLMRLVHRWN